MLSVTTTQARCRIMLDDGSLLQVSSTGYWTHDGRQVWAYKAATPDKGTIAKGEDLHTGVGKRDEPQMMMCALLGFMEHYSESSAPDIGIGSEERRLGAFFSAHDEEFFQFLLDYDPDYQD